MDILGGHALHVHNYQLNNDMFEYHVSHDQSKYKEHDLLIQEPDTIEEEIFISVPISFAQSGRSAKYLKWAAFENERL